MRSTKTCSNAFRTASILQGFDVPTATLMVNSCGCGADDWDALFIADADGANTTSADDVDRDGVVLVLVVDVCLGGWRVE